MLSRKQAEQAQAASREILQELSVAITPEEASKIEIADFGLGDLHHVGLQLLTYINTARVCAKELILFPHQFCPEHYHPAISGEQGKEETFRCRSGEVYLYVPGEVSSKPKATIPAGYEKYLTAWHEIHLRPGEQYTIFPETRHWFQAGPNGAVVSEFSTRSRDEYDVFTDPRIVRAPRIAA